MPRADKAEVVTELADRLREVNAAVLTEYRGLSVAQLQALRRALGANVKYRVVKNTLTKRAAEQAGVTAFDGLLEGPSAIAFVTGDPVEAAKGLRDFARTNPRLVIKGGLLEGKSMSPDEIRQLADLESRAALLSRVAGTMKAPLQGAASLLSAPLSQAARLVEALRQEQEKQGEAEEVTATSQPS